MTNTKYRYATLLSLTLLFVISGMSFAAETVPQHTYCKAAVCGLELIEQNGESRFAPILKSAVEINVSGSAVYTSVTQTFTNPSEAWVEGIYTYPLPSGAAVNQLHMKIGQRIIVGEIKEKHVAERTYLKAKAAGKKTSLVKAHRPNIFTTKLANLGPRESVAIRIDYVMELPLSAAAQQLRFPMVVGPRYSPISHSTNQAGREIELQSADRSLYEIATDTSPLPEIHTLADGNSEHNRHELLLNINLGVALDSIRSLYHKVDIKQLATTDYRVRLTKGSVVPNRDFVIEFSPAQNDIPQTALLSEIKNGYRYGLFMIMPPKAAAAAKLPREVTFILDRSGSMGGTSIVQAKAALVHALEQLTSEDRFNVIWFNNNHHMLFPEIVPASSANLSRARAIISQIQASGGTEMLGALKPALNTRGSADHVQQLIFITDGNVSNEENLFTFIENHLAERRLFTVGIGSAPNQYFLRHAATLGRGLHTFIGNTNEVQSQMDKLFKKLAQPMLRNLSLQTSSSEVEFWPPTLPDLYADEPIAIAFRAQTEDVGVTISGELPDHHWQASGTLNGGQQRRGIAELWAKRKINHSMDNYRRSHDNPDAQEKARQAILQTALSHHLVSKFTSLVAVDKTPSNLAQTRNQTGRVARHRPHGWTLGSTSARLPQTGTDSKLRIALGLLMFAIIGAGFIRKTLNPPTVHLTPDA